MTAPRSLVARNVVVTLATQIVSWALTFVVTIYLPRYVGAAGLGKLTFAASFVGVFAVFVPLGTSTVLVKEIARNRSRTGELLLAALLARAPLVATMAALAVVAARLMGYPASTRQLVLVSALCMIVFTANDALSSALQGQERMPRQSVAAILDKVLSSGIMVALILRHAPLWALAAVGGFSGVVSLLVNLSAFRGLRTTVHLPRLKSVWTLVAAGMPFFGWTVFRTLYGQTDPIVLSMVANDATVGWYAAAFRLVGTALFVPNAITFALMPTLSRLYREDPGAFQRMVRRAFALVMLFGVPAGFVLIGMPDELIRLMHYPATFQHSIPVLRLGGVGVVLYSAAAVLGIAVITCDQQRRMFHISVLATILGVPACFLGAYLTHHYWSNGAIGAVGSDVILEAFIIGAYLRILPFEILDRKTLSRCGRYLLACGPIAALILTCHSHQLWMIPSSVVLYVATCWLLGCCGPEEMRSLRSAFGSKLQPAQSA